MRRALVVLALMLVPLAAWAGKTIVVMPGHSPSYTPTGAAVAQAEGRWLSMYRTLGMDFDALRSEQLKTEWARTLVFPVPGGGTQAYVAGVAVGFCTGTGGATISPNPNSPFVPDSMTRQANWPTGPWAFMSPPAQIGFNVLSDRAQATGFPACTTGIAANPAPLSQNKYQTNDFMPGTSFVWRCFQNRTGYTPAASAPAGVFRALVKQAPSGWNPYAEQGLAPSNWDSMPSGTPDTLAVVARYKKNGAGPPIAIAVTGNGTDNMPHMRQVISLAFIDSAAGKTVLGQTSPLPVRFTFHVGPLCASGHYSAAVTGGLDPGIGPYPGDSVETKSTLAGYQAMGLKGTVLVQTDSMGFFPQQAEWVRTLWPLAHVTPFDMAGVNSGVGGAATASRVVDAFGATRLRSLLPAGCTDPRGGCIQCGTDTSAVFCYLKRAFAKLAAYYGASRVDRVIACPLEDWTPTYFDRAAGDLDSLKWVLYLAGVRGIRVGNLSPRNWGVGGAPRGYFTALRVHDVTDPATGRDVGRMVFMPSRDSDGDGASSLFPHDTPGEFLQGLLEGDWYVGSRSPVYVNGHDFFVRTVIFEILGSQLGGKGTANQNYRMGYWMARNLWAQCKAANSFGRTVIEPSYGEETANWLIQSGLR